jgi:hypothetical protein
VGERIGYDHLKADTVLSSLELWAEGLLFLRRELFPKYLAIGRYNSCQSRLACVLSGQGLIKFVRHEGKKPPMIPRWQRVCPGGPRADRRFGHSEPLAHGRLRDM